MPKVTGTNLDQLTCRFANLRRSGKIHTAQRMYPLDCGHTDSRVHARSCKSQPRRTAGAALKERRGTLPTLANSSTLSSMTPYGTGEEFTQAWVSMPRTLEGT